jgi:hypothetical protein
MRENIRENDNVRGQKWVRFLFPSLNKKMNLTSFRLSLSQPSFWKTTMHATHPLVLPESDITVNLYSSELLPKFDVERFAGALLHVWLQIEENDRHIIECHWKKGPIPSIFLPDPWNEGESDLACCEIAGRQLKFDWPTMKGFPDKLLEVPIAHEMSHVFQFACGKSRYELGDQDLRGLIDAVYDCLTPGGRAELHADETMLRWGYDPLDTWVWLILNGKFAGSASKRRKKPMTEKEARKAATQARQERYYFGA